MTNLQRAKDEEHHVKIKNENEIGESHKSTEYRPNVYLLNYTLK